MIIDLSWIKKVLRYPSIMEFSRDERVMTGARTLISYYYYFVPYLALTYLQSNISDKPNFDPLWPLAWTRWIGMDTDDVVLVVKVFFVAAALMGVLCHRFRSVRVLVFIAFWQVHALESSFGYINHQWYHWAYSSCIFMFLPDIWKHADPERNRRFLLLIWFAQALIALTYTMAGINKVAANIEQYWMGMIHGFSIVGLSYTIADWLPKLQSEALLAGYIIEYPIIGWFLYLCLQAIQVFSLWVMVRPSLQRFWGAAIVLFHIGTVLLMGISFQPLVILIILLFLHSPFIQPYPGFTAFLRDLPVIGHVMEAADALLAWQRTARAKPRRKRAARA